MSSEPEATALSDADEVERHQCPRCGVQPGSPCRSRSGAVTTAYHTGRFTMVPRLAKLLRVPTPADRSPGQPWRPGTLPPAPIPADAPSADIRVGYARCSHLTRPTAPERVPGRQVAIGRPLAARRSRPGQHPRKGGSPAMEDFIKFLMFLGALYGAYQSARTGGPSARKGQWAEQWPEIATVR